MKRLLLLTTLIGLLFTSPNSFAQSSKPKRATIKYGNGVKYVGEIRKVSPKGFIIRKMKFKHGTGIMYFANGDQLDGEWYNDQCKRGTYKFAYGDIFEGEISESSIQNGKMIFSSGLGTMIFASEGDITLGYKIWHYPANCSFTGTIKDKKPYTGTFDCTLTTKDGDSFTGRLSDGHFGYGKIEYASGDTFEGNFISDTPSSGKYRYASITEITRANHKWEIPAGCVFEGNIVPFTGTVNMEITNADGDKFVGKLNNGAPDEGTMVFAATGHTETGKWKDGLSPKEYEIKLKAETKAWLDAQRKAREARQQKEEQAKVQKLAQEKQKQQKEEQRKKSLIQKYGQRYGSLIYQGKLELGMTQQMCQEVIDIKSYDIGKSMRSGHRVETWTFNKDKQDMQVAAAMTQLSGEEAMALALLMGFADSVGASTPKYSVLVFTDGKLTSLY